jgi:tetratricopeptide (TPR) repeat protein
LDENTKISDMQITDEFYFVDETDPVHIVAQRIRELGEGGVVLVTKSENKVIGYITDREIIDLVASGASPKDVSASEIMDIDFMEVMGEETLGQVLPIIAEKYPNAIVVIDFNGKCIGYFSKNDYRDALAGLGCYDKSRDPETPEDWRTQGIAMSSMGQMSEALICYEKSLALYPNKEQAWFELARSFEASNRLKDAIMCYDRVVSINPNNDDAWLNRGNIYLTLRMPDRAVQSFNHAVALNPHNEGAMINMGLAYSDLGNFEKAINCYENAEALKGETAELWYRKGNAFDKSDKFKLAIKCYDRAIQLNPKHEDSWFNKGAALHMLGKDKKAIQCLQEALNINPNNESAREAITICEEKKSFF